MCVFFWGGVLFFVFLLENLAHAECGESINVLFSCI